ncbi:unnamed protein product [Caenorhabditis angaria]|uniref:Receptor L-domain domain-containing protein n=1 Tax=Caenorhabditis angaria TaxID=860376 RepID=A0A9P1IJU7_9PELO|nr:unnamed protein product [Caenorhabditis angaria]
MSNASFFVKNMITSETYCRLDSLSFFNHSNLPENCQVLTDSIVINGSITFSLEDSLNSTDFLDFFYFSNSTFQERLNSIQEIFGNIVVMNSDLENLDFPNLRRIYNFQPTFPVILLQNNTRLSEISFPAFEKIDYFGAYNSTVLYAYSNPLLKSCQDATCQNLGQISIDPGDTDPCSNFSSSSLKSNSTLLAQIIYTDIIENSNSKSFQLFFVIYLWFYTKCGIDLNKCESSLDQQKRAFRRQIQLAFKYDMALVIHCRTGRNGDAEAECLQILKEELNKPGQHRYLRIHRHCYMENWENAKKWIEICPNIVFGFTPAVFNFSASQLEAIRNIPLNRIILETDAPYFVPSMFKDILQWVNLPGTAASAALLIAKVKNIPIGELMRHALLNTRRTYSL